MACTDTMYRSRTSQVLIITYKGLALLSQSEPTGIYTSSVKNKHTKFDMLLQKLNHSIALCKTRCLGGANSSRQPKKLSRTSKISHRGGAQMEIDCANQCTITLGLTVLFRIQTGPKFDLNFSHHLQLKYYVSKMGGRLWFGGS